MAQATTIRFGDQALLIGNGATPEVFLAPCGLTTLNKVTNIQTVTTDVPDCDDPDLPSYLEIDPVSKQIVISGSGVLAQEALPMWDAWDRGVDLQNNPLPDLYKNVRWYRNLLAANGGGYLEGPALLTRYEENAASKQRYLVNIAVTFNGKPTWHPGA